MIVERNFQNTKGYKYGEIDIIARYKNTLVFVEVKTRLTREGEIILPEENISPKKLKNMEKIASTYIRIKNMQDIAYRFDAVSVLFNPQSKIAKVRHLEHIFF